MAENTKIEGTAGEALAMKRDPDGVYWEVQRVLARKDISDCIFALAKSLAQGIAFGTESPAQAGDMAEEIFKFVKMRVTENWLEIRDERGLDKRDGPIS